MNKILYKSGFILCLFFAFSTASNAEIITAVVKMPADTPRSVSVRDSAGRALEHFSAFVPSLVFVNQDLIAEQMRKYSCNDESCLLTFARNAKIDCLLFVHADEESDGVRVKFTARVPGIPYGGKTVQSYTALMPKSGLARDTMNAATEEHAGRFLALFLKSVQLPVSASVKDGKLVLDEEMSGSHDVFSKVQGTLFSESKGKDLFEKGQSSGTSYNSAETYFVLKNYKREGEDFDDYIYGRKHEMLFSGSAGTSPFTVLSFVPVISAVSPIALPLGYYRNTDYQGLLLSGCAMTPWAVISTKYLINAYWDKDSHLTRKERGGRNFGLYWLFAGNASLVVDMYAHEALNAAGNYKQTEYLGRTETAIGLSVLTPGGGLFYRGERLYGHLYYQAGTMLMYKTLTTFSSGEKYDSETGKYVKVKADKKKAFTWLAGLLVLKAGEIVHAAAARDNVESSYDTAGVHFQPVMEYDNGFRGGAGLVYQW